MSCTVDSHSASQELYSCVHSCTFQSNADPEDPVKTVSFTVFRKKASGYIDLAEKGETIRIMRHGRAVARLVPAGPESNMPAWTRPGLRLKVSSGASLAQAVLAERRSGR